MELKNLTLHNYRNYRDCCFTFDPGVNLIVGDNAQGKTNLLEAIGYLGTGKSFRTSKNQELMGFDPDFTEISGSLFSQEREQSLRWVLFSADPGSCTTTASKRKPSPKFRGCFRRCCSARRI